jgi:hypothetical protein
MTKPTLEWEAATSGGTGSNKEARSKCGRYRIKWLPGKGVVTYYVYCDPKYVGSRTDFGEAQQLATSHLRGK